MVYLLRALLDSSTCSCVGAVIGKKGAMIQELIRKCRVHIWVIKASAATVDAPHTFVTQPQAGGCGAGEQPRSRATNLYYGGLPITSACPRRHRIDYPRGILCEFYGIYLLNSTSLLKNERKKRAGPTPIKVAELLSIMPSTMTSSSQQFGLCVSRDIILPPDDFAGVAAVTGTKITVMRFITPSPTSLRPEPCSSRNTRAQLWSSFPAM